MSVAFRRESDEEHLEPRFELPVPAGSNPVTARGLRLIARRVADLEEAQRAATDPEEIKRIARDLRYWHTRRVTAEPMPPADGDETGFGSRVTFRLAGRERTVDLVGHDEADPAHERIAITAPLARALSGAMAGERVAFAGRADAIEVLAVEPIPDEG